MKRSGAPEATTAASRRGPEPSTGTDRPERRFELDGMRGAVAPEVWSGKLDEGFEAELRRLLDPANAARSLHWGRSYLYEAAWPGRRVTGDVAVVVKQFRHDNLQSRLRRRRRGTRARLSFHAARRLRRLGIATPEPVLYAESKTLEGPAWFVCRLIPEARELRHVLRALNAGGSAARFPAIDGVALLRRVGALAAELHRHGIWFRDLTSGNVLLSEPATDAELYLVDLNRARFRRRLSMSQRLRDLSRMPVLRPTDRSEYLRGYRPGGLTRFRRLWFEVYHHGFRLKIRSKKGARRALRRLADLLLPRRRAHPHIPAAERGAKPQERAVWDPLTDQPHQQATRGQRLGVRLRDAAHHARPLGRAAGPLFASLVEAKRLRRRIEQAPERVPFRGLGVAVGPGSAPVDALVEAIDDLGVENVLLRFHLWQGLDKDLLRLAAILGRKRPRPADLVFQLSQDRSLVRDGGLWLRRVEEAVAALSPLGSRFLIGQAPNRSKWGVWRPDEYWKLLAAAGAAVRAANPDARVLAPAVIDFEPHATAGLVHSRLREHRFDILASQLYVDRRGAPENTQLGFDLAGKLALLRAVARRAPDCGSDRSWVTEFNWPLEEGPHAPAGRDVAVDEDTQASYLVRYCLEALGTGLAERVYWWQLAAAGYGLIDPRGGSSRRRPAYRALRQLRRELAGTQVERLLLPAGVRGYRAVTPGGLRDATSGIRVAGRAEPDVVVKDRGEVQVLWTLDRRGQAYRPPGGVRAAYDRDGVELPPGPVRLGPAPVYLEIGP